MGLMRLASCKHCEAVIGTPHARNCPHALPQRVAICADERDALRQLFVVLRRGADPSIILRSDPIRRVQEKVR